MRPPLLRLYHRTEPIPASTVALLLSHRAISPNGVHPPGSGTTALHLASSLGRIDILTLLLDQETIDDSLLDANAKSCTDVAKGKDVVRVIEGKLINCIIISILTTSQQIPVHSSMLHTAPSSALTYYHLSTLRPQPPSWLCLNPPGSASSISHTLTMILAHPYSMRLPDGKTYASLSLLSAPELMYS